MNAINTHTIVLTAGGQSPYGILVGENASLPEIFAGKELQRYVKKVTGVLLPIHSAPSAGHEYIQLGVSLAGISLQGDEHAVVRRDKRIILTGGSPRGVLYAVYAFLEKFLGLRWFHLCEETLATKVYIEVEIEDEIFRPVFKERGIVMHGFELDGMIEWMSQNKLNSIFFNFGIWDREKERLRPKLEERGIWLTLGGHDLGFFLSPKKYFAEHPEWFACRDGKRTGEGQYCFLNQKLVSTLVDKIITYCREEEALRKICLWPMDTGKVCQCDDCSKQSFNYNYIVLIDALKNALDKVGLKVEVEHIAYNAGLNFEMLAVPAATSNPFKSHTLFAYWGRNYSEPFRNATTSSDITARNMLLDWLKSCKDRDTDLTVFEYYTDFWMLSQLYPLSMSQVIADDMKYYHQEGVSAVCTLVVPCQYGVFEKQHFPWEWLMGLNAYLFAKLSWNPMADVALLVSDYCSNYYGAEKTRAMRWLNTLEEQLPKISRLNVPLFRLRFMDIWKKDDDSGRGGTEFAPKDWMPEDAVTRGEEERVDLCRRLTESLAPLARETKCFWGKAVSDPLSKLGAYCAYVTQRIISLNHQLTAQQLIRTGRYFEAKKRLLAAVEIENKLYGEDLDDCKKWIVVMEKKTAET